ncbi:Ribokinase [Paenibacillus plantiphilus]|uniref:Ribokinase n=1 Tax=Paenibacillus plantiphilus TaxID=2905650 RepID=A0ABN8GK68_9BACL|nr:ribokinase [Paenibacillus plantiphilus]CAH1206349.1 Ribokinase [Paenibacillus plantiphilus]
MSKPRIAVVGSLNMDIVVSMKRQPQMGETIAGDAVHYMPGGKGANQALGCSRLNAETTMIGCVGSDPFGPMVLDGLAASGVGLDSVGVLEGETTGTAHISLAQGDNCIVVVAGANAMCTAAYVRQHEPAISSADVVIAQLEIPLEAVIEAFSIAKGKNAATILNPAPARALPEELLLLTDYITPNESEWELISGVSGQEDEVLLGHTIAEWEKQYNSKVVMTRGDKGCSYVEEGQLKTFQAPRVKVVDTTGAGDSFNAALAYGLAQRKPMAESVALAVTSASLSVQRFGAQGGMPTLLEVEAALQPDNR